MTRYFKIRNGEDPESSSDEELTWVLLLGVVAVVSEIPCVFSTFRFDNVPHVSVIVAMLDCKRWLEAHFA